MSHMSALPVNLLSVWAYKDCVILQQVLSTCLSPHLFLPSHKLWSYRQVHEASKTREASWVNRTGEHRGAQTLRGQRGGRGVERASERERFR